MKQPSAIVRQAWLFRTGRQSWELKFNQAVCFEHLGQYQKALELFQAYTEEFGSDEAAEHEIAFLKTR